MASRVTVNITARDLTRPELQRMRRNFHNLGSDLDRTVGARTRENFDRLRDSLNATSRDLRHLRGAIPDDEFNRLDTMMRRAQATMRRGFGNMNTSDWDAVQRRIREIEQSFRRIDSSNGIRVRADLSALRRADAQLAAWRRQQSGNAVRVPVRPDVDRHSFRRMLVRTLTSPFRTAGATLGGILSDGVGQGVIGGFQAAGPLVKVAFIAILTSILSVLGAALSGIIVTALGLAFVGVAGVSAAMSEQVKKKWKTVLESLKENFREVGEPMIPVLERALGKLQQLGDKITPVFKKAIEDATPATNAFIDKLFEGVERMGKAMFKPIMDAWDVFAPVFGDALADAMEMWGKSFADMADLVRNHSAEIELAIRAVFAVIDFLIDTVTFLGKVWVWNMQTMGEAMGAIIHYAVRPLVQGVLDAVGAMLGAFDKFSFLMPPSIAKSLRSANDSFGDFRDNTLEKLQQMEDKSYGFGDALDTLNRTRVLNVEIAGWQRDLDAAKAKLKSVPKSKQAEVKANIRDLQRKIDQARHELGTLHDRTVHVWVKSHWDNQVANAFRASGGNIGAAATGGVRNNKVMVGEHGPEIVDLPGGSHVRSNSDTRRFLAGQGPTSGPVVVRIEAGTSDTDQLLLKLLRRAIRVEGGDVQYVLGTGKGGN